MNRRRFLFNAGLATAGSALSGTLVNCGVDYRIVIPCLGPAAAPVPVPGMTYLRASEIGCALDCDLQDGRNKHTGGKPTDDGPKINAAMAGASASNPITLIIDGSAMVSGLFLPADGHWSIAGLGCGTGFFVKKGTNNDGIHNGAPDAATPSDPGPPVPARGKNVSLSNFSLNGNQGDGSSGDSTSGTRQGRKHVWYFGINLMNLDNITIQNVVVVNTPAYHIRLSNVGNVVVAGCVFKSYGLSTDGVHFDGPANDISISQCDFTTGDDAIALNCPEGYTGDISRVQVTNCTFNSLSLMRMYTRYDGDNFRVDSVNVSNCSGTLSEAGFLIGLTNGSNPQSIASLTISDCTLTAPTVLAIAENFGTITMRNVNFTPAPKAAIWVSPQVNKTIAFVRPSPLSGDVVSVGESLIFDNCTITRTSDVEVVGVIMANKSVISSLTFNGFSVQDAKPYSAMPELLEIESGSIQQLVIDSLTGTNIKTLVSGEGFSGIHSVSGAGVLATGFEIADDVMANGVPYLSASTGLPSIKVAGVVESYPQG